MESSRNKSKLQKWWKYTKKYSKEFCEMSSIQGLSYIVKDISVVERVWWIIVLLLSFWGSCYMVAKIADKWLTTPVLVSLDTKEMHIKDIPFPAVTICPESKFSHTCLNYTKVLHDRKKGNFFGSNFLEHLYFDLMAVLCRKENHEGTRELMNKAFADMGMSLSSEEDDDKDEVQVDNYAAFFDSCSTVDMKNSFCQWMGKIVDCEKVLTEIMTDEGLCYSFNMYDLRDLYSEENVMKYIDEGNRRQDWNPDNGYSDSTQTSHEDMYPRRAFLSGSKNAFIAVFTTNNSDIEYACRDLAVQGMRVAIHSPTNIPRMSQVFFSVGLNRITTVAVKPTLTKTSEKILDYDPKKRNCFFGYERQLKFFQFYSQSNCNMECFTNYTEAHCGCVSFFMPRDNDTRVCSLKKRFCLEYARLNYTQDILREHLKINRSNIHDGKTTNCHCLPLCAELTFNAEISTSDWEFNHPDEVDYDQYRHNLSNLHASAVKVFFKDSFFLPTQRDELYGLSDMISNIGGALGLITGFSLFSLAEIVYFLSVKLFVNFREHGFWAGPRTPSHDNSENLESFPLENQEENHETFVNVHI